MLEIRCHHDLREVESQRHAINALNLASSVPDPFSTFEFYEHYLDTEARYPSHGNPRLWLLLAFDGERLVGHLALKETTHRVLGLRCSKLDLLAGYIGGRPSLVCHAANSAAIGAAMYDFLLNRRREWGLLEFPQQCSDSALLLLPAAAVSGRCRLRSWDSPPHGPIPLHGASLASYFAARSSKMRSNISRQMRLLMAAGEVQLLTSYDPERVRELFDLYRAIEARSWKARAGADIGRSQHSLAYYEGLMHPASPIHIGIQILLLDGVPVAGLVNGAFNNSLYALETAFDDRYKDLSPGSTMMFLGVRLAIEGGFDFYDLLWGFDYAKNRWGAIMKPTECVQIYRIDSPQYWHRLVGDFLRRYWYHGTGRTRLLFNPLRRGARAAQPPLETTSHESVKPLGGEGWEAALQGRGESLSAAELARLMPFPTTGDHRSQPAAPVEGTGCWETPNDSRQARTATTLTRGSGLPQDNGATRATRTLHGY